LITLPTSLSCSDFPVAEFGPTRAIHDAEKPQFYRVELKRESSVISRFLWDNQRINADAHSSRALNVKSRYPYLMLGISALVLILVSLSATVFVLYPDFKFGDQFVSTRTEELSIYAVWKVAHGYPAYEWPTRDWYSLSMYNWLFYYGYGIVGRLSQVDEMRAVQIERTLTLFFGCVGAALTYLIAHNLVKKLELVPNRMVLSAGSLLLWFGWGGMILVAYSIRADYTAQVFSLGGLGIFLWAMHARPSAFVLSGFFFYLAWSCKQSVVFTFASCLLYLFLTKEWRSMMTFAASFVLPVTASLVLGGEVYRYNVLYAPSINPFAWRRCIEGMSMLVLHGIFIYGFLAYLPLLLADLNIRRHGWKKFSTLPLGTRQMLVLLLAAGISGVMDLLILGKEGSSVNVAFEFFIITTLLAMVGVHHLLQTESRYRNAWLIYASVLFWISAVIPAKNMMLYKAGKMGTAPLISQSDHDSRVLYGEWLRTLPAPLLIRDAIFALPWYSNQGRYPAILTDFLWYPCAESHGLLAGGGIQTLVKNRYFGALLLQAGDKLLQTARDAGYEEVPLSPDQRYFPSSTLVSKEGPVTLFVRPSSGQAKR
jgi:hypothetical protein